MFRQALAVARQFTGPVVLSRRTVGGTCSSAIGAFVVVNHEGWIVTAAHILEQLRTMSEQVDSARAHDAAIAAIEADGSLNRQEKRRRLRAAGHLDRNHTDRFSAWWGRDGVQVSQMIEVAHVDLGIAKLEPFDPSWYLVYPQFKDPTKDCEPGTSLCKLGFPFHTITPTWDEAVGSFRLPAGALPIPLFPIEGMFTRTAEIVVLDAAGAP